MLWLHYDGLVNQRELSLRAIAQHMDNKLDEKLIPLLILHSSMEHMRSISNKINLSPEKSRGQST